MMKKIKKILVSQPRPTSEKSPYFDIMEKHGVKIDFPQGWVHLRKSNTEPIIRVYSEAPTREQADKFAGAIIDEIKRIARI